MTIPITRREFLEKAAVAGAAVSLGPLALNAGSQTAVAGPKLTAPSWADKPRRWAQLTLVEDDPGKFDLGFWLDYFKRTHSDGACLSAGGCVAYYPTQVPFHHRSQWLGERDPFGDLVSGCRKMGMVVLARTDPHATYDDVKAAHPDWIAVDAEGKPRRHWAAPDMWVTCALGPYNFEFMTAVKKEIMSRYRVDGFFLNRWDGSGDCYCVHCQRNFKEASGFDLPRTTNPQDPARRAFLKWREDRLFELWQLWEMEVRKINPDSCVVPNNAAGALSPHDGARFGASSAMMVADRQARHGVMPVWRNGKTVKEFRAVLGRKPMVGMFGVGLEEAYRWKDSVQSDAEIRIWALDEIANGARPWFIKFSGVLWDRRWLKPVEDLFAWHAQNEKYLRYETPLARVAVVYSQQTAWYYGGEQANAKVEDHALGWCQALVEARVPFEMVHDRLLDAEHTRQFKTLILPNIAALSDAQCDQLLEFVLRGGSLIATHETSLYDEWGVRRQDFGLADLLGIKWSGKSESGMRNSYLTLEHAAVPHHPLLRGLEDAPRVINGVSRLEVEPRAEFGPAPITLVPSYPDLPMEEVFPRQAKTNIAEVFLRQPGASSGRVVYFSWDIDRTFWEVLNPDHSLLLRNAVAWATNEPPVVEVAGPGMVEVTAWRNEGSIVVHLVNLTNPMAMKGPYREFIPVGEQKVTVRLPEGMKAKKVRLLVAGTSPQWAGTREVRVTVPSVLDHEVVAIDL